MGSDQGLPSHVGTHLAIAQDEVRQHGENRLATRALNAPDGEPTEPKPGIMGMAGEAATAATGRFMVELNTFHLI